MKQLEKEIAETNKQSMMKRYQLYGMKYEAGKDVYTAGAFQNKEEADGFIPPVKIATVKIEWEEEI